MHLKTNYVIGAWSGPRQEYPNGTCFIKRHLAQLQTFKHNLDLVTIGYPRWPQESHEYTEFMQSLIQNPILSDGTPVDVMRCENHGLSYGQWSNAFKKYRSTFDRYIFIEDDYVPAIDYFDGILHQLQDQLKVSYLCGLVFDQSGRYGAFDCKHAAISNGIVTAECLEAVCEKFGCIPFMNGSGPAIQISFTSSPMAVGHTVEDYLSVDGYRCMFWDHREIVIYGRSREGKDIFVPIQHLDQMNEQNYRHVKEKQLGKLCL